MIAKKEAGRLAGVRGRHTAQGEVDPPIFTEMYQIFFSKVKKFLASEKNFPL